jgi:hypothetical protein
MSSFKSDYIFGIEKEREVFDIIKKFFNDPEIKKADSKYAKHDFVGSNLYELKSRNCSFSKFPTTLLPKSKVIDDKNNQIYLFNFTDGLYYIRYAKDIFDKMDCKMFKRIQRTDYYDKPQLYYHIPTDLLTKIIV